jgi:Putative addiction module component
MSEEAVELLKRALTLPLEERAELASSLIDSLGLTASEDVEAAWQEEIARRPRM